MRRALLAAVAMLAAALACAGAALADPPSEYTPPAGGGAPKGLVIILHYGAWHGGDGRGIPVMRPWARWFNGHGWAALNDDYRTGPDSIVDVLSTYDQWRARLDPALPICVYGQSAGGHLALMLAAMRPSVDCVIAAAAPTDFETLRKGRTAGEKWAVTVARQTWHDLHSWSPIHWAPSIRATLGLEFASNDHWVPASQGKELARKVPGSTLSILRPGGVRWVHSYVSRATIKAGHRMEEHVLDAAIAAHPAPRPAQPARPSGCVVEPLVSALGKTPVAGPAIAALLTSVAC